MRKVLILALTVFIVAGVMMTGPVQVLAEDSIADGTYPVEFTFEGGSGRGGVESISAELNGGKVSELYITMTSPNYDYCIYYDEQYVNSSEEGNSVFIVPFVEESFLLTADTVAMSQPHEVDYTVTLDMDSLWSAASEGSGSGTLWTVIAVIAIVCVAVGFFAVRSSRNRANRR